ncbi:MAG TPA: tol-pal system protein YbgF [Terriglobia bacterium]|nr:tol-pal system protein YbgF [Terriglobia bacterium]
MRNKYLAGFALLLAIFATSSQPGFAVSKEIVQMMTELDNLQQQVMNLQNTVASQTAILKTLVQQASENINSMKATIAKMQEAQQRSLATSSNQIDSLSSQVQQLSSSLDEAKGQISKLSGQVAQTQKMMQTINTAPNNGSNGGAAPNSAPPGSNPGAQPGSQGAPSANGVGAPGSGDASAQSPPPPDPDVLYKSAYTDYTQGLYPLAIQGFQQYLQDYGDTDLASNAQFYIGDSYYLQKDYKDAVKEYDKCIQAYPDGNKAAAAYLKEGYALLALGQKSNGLHALNALIRKYPDTHEADLARQRVHGLAISQR